MFHTISKQYASHWFWLSYQLCIIIHKLQYLRHFHGFSCAEAAWFNAYLCTSDTCLFTWNYVDNRSNKWIITGFGLYLCELKHCLPQNPDSSLAWNIWWPNLKIYDEYVIFYHFVKFSDFVNLMNFHNFSLILILINTFTNNFDFILIIIKSKHDWNIFFKTRRLSKFLYWHFMLLIFFGNF